MLQNFEKSNAYILIDIAYLNKKIEEGYEYYGRLYPQKQFKDFDLIEMLKCFTSTCRINVPNNNVNVVLFYKLEDSVLAHSKGRKDVASFGNYPNPGVFRNTNGCSMRLYSFFADPNPVEFEFAMLSAYDKEFLGYLRKIVEKPEVSSIIVCKDTEDENGIDAINYELENINKETDQNKKIYLIGNYNSYLGPTNSNRFFSVVLDYVIAICMGLSKYEW